MLWGVGGTPEHVFTTTRVPQGRRRIKTIEPTLGNPAVSERPMALRPRLTTGLLFSWSLTIVKSTRVGRKINRTEKNIRKPSNARRFSITLLRRSGRLVIEKSAALVYRDVLVGVLAPRPRAMNPRPLEGGEVDCGGARLLEVRRRREEQKLTPADKVLFVGVES